MISKLVSRFLLTIFAISLLCGVAWGYTVPVRDVQTGLFSDSKETVSFRYMRHIWTASDGTLAAVLQKGGRDGQGLVLVKSATRGQSWSVQQEITPQTYVVSDGVIVSGNDIFLVTSYLFENGDPELSTGGTLTNQPAIDVKFIKMTYYDNGEPGWTVSDPVRVYDSSANMRATRASIAVDSRGVVWCAFRLYDVATGRSRIGVKYSTDNGATWADSNQTFAETAQSEKSPKVISLGQRIAMVYQFKIRNAGGVIERYKKLAYRDDTLAPQASWTIVTSPITLEETVDDPYGTHWTVAADNPGNLHMSYQDYGIHYIKYDFGAGSWTGHVLFPDSDAGVYSTISVGLYGGDANPVYLFTRNSQGTKVIATNYLGNQMWSDWSEVSQSTWWGYLRMITPERFLFYLPLLHETGNPGELIFDGICHYAYCPVN